MAAPRIKVALVDLSGTLHIDDVETPGAVEALNRLRGSGLKLRFVTNTTKESKRALLSRLHGIGFALGAEEIYTSLTAAQRHVEKKGLRPLLMLDKRALEDFEGISQENVNAVLVGLAPDKFSYENMNTAFRLVMNGAPLIAIHKSRYYMRKDGLALGPGPFVSVLEYATDKKAEIVGKPEKSFFLEAMEEFRCHPNECVMIGDDARDDIGGAVSAGMLGILVKTGKYRLGDEEKVQSSGHCTVVENFSAAVDFIMDKLTCNDS